MTKKRTFDFCDGRKKDAAPSGRRAETANDRPTGGSEFFIDGWDAYGRWLEELRRRMDERRDEDR